MKRIKSIKKTKKTILKIIARNAVTIPAKPKIAATIAITKKIRDRRSMVLEFMFWVKII